MPRAACTTDDDASRSASASASSDNAWSAARSCRCRGLRTRPQNLRRASGSNPARPLEEEQFGPRHAEGHVEAAALAAGELATWAVASSRPTTSISSDGSRDGGRVAKCRTTSRPTARRAHRPATGRRCRSGRELVAACPGSSPRTSRQGRGTGGLQDLDRRRLPRAVRPDMANTSPCSTSGRGCPATWLDSLCATRWLRSSAGCSTVSSGPDSGRQCVRHSVYSGGWRGGHVPAPSVIRVAGRDGGLVHRGTRGRPRQLRPPSRVGRPGRCRAGEAFGSGPVRQPGRARSAARPLSARGLWQAERRSACEHDVHGAPGRRQRHGRAGDAPACCVATTSPSGR